MKSVNDQHDTDNYSLIENVSCPTSENKWSKTDAIYAFAWKTFFIALISIAFLAPIAIFEKFYLTKSAFYLAFWYLLFIFIDSFRIIKTKSLVWLISVSCFIYLLFNLPYLIVCHHCLDFVGFDSIFQTNPREAKEFLSSFSLITYLYPVSFLVATIFITKHKSFNISKSRCKKLRHSIRLLALVCFALLFVILWSECKKQSPSKTNRYFAKNIENILCWPAFFRELHESLESNRMIKESCKDLQCYTYESQCINDNTPKTYVIIVGESLRRDHMSIYGYDRETTPLLNLQQNLVIFDNTISGANRTVTAVPLALTPATVETFDLVFKKGSIIQAMNEANFKTYWITDQDRLGCSINGIAAIASFADQAIHFYDKWMEKDEVLLPGLKEALNENTSGQSKVIFLHTLGSHTKYTARYTEQFNVYPKDKGVVGKINSYDNTVCYTDWFIDSVIKLLEDKNAVLLYFSDHGEELYDTNAHLFAHSHSNPTKHAYNIPFFIWFSNKYKKSEGFQRFDLNLIQQRKSAKYSTQYMFYTIADLVGLRFDSFDPTKSILNTEFQEYNNRKVLAGNNVQLEYESLPE